MTPQHEAEQRVSRCEGCLSSFALVLTKSVDFDSFLVRKRVKKLVRKLINQPSPPTTTRTPPTSYDRHTRNHSLSLKHDHSYRTRRSNFRLEIRSMLWGQGKTNPHHSFPSPRVLLLAPSPSGPATDKARSRQLSLNHPGDKKDCTRGVPQSSGRVRLKGY